MDVAIEAFYDEIDAAKNIVLAKQRLQPTSQQAIVPTAEEEAGPEPSVTAPCCPHCGNLDARGLLDDPDSLEAIHAHSGRQGPPPGPYTVPTSITSDLRADAPSYPSMSMMVCLPCGKAAFSYRADVWLFSGVGPLNMKRASLAFLARTLYSA